VLIAVFWAGHFTIMWLRAEISTAWVERGLFEGTLRRIIFALFGAFLSYVLYRCLRPLRLREFGRQAADRRSARPCRRLCPGGGQHLHV
jgi:hypothetical protein